MSSEDFGGAVIVTGCEGEEVCSLGGGDCTAELDIGFVLVVSLDIIGSGALLGRCCSVVSLRSCGFAAVVDSALAAPHQASQPPS